LIPVGERVIFNMRIITESTLREFWRNYPETEGPLKAWIAEVLRADWKNPADVKKSYGSASILQGSKVIFNIKGNKYRLIVLINYGCGIVRIRWIGTHRQYDDIDVKDV